MTRVNCNNVGCEQIAIFRQLNSVMFTGQIWSSFFGHLNNPPYNMSQDPGGIGNWNSYILLHLLYHLSYYASVLVKFVNSTILNSLIKDFIMKQRWCHISFAFSHSFYLGWCFIFTKQIIFYCIRSAVQEIIFIYRGDQNIGHQRLATTNKNLTFIILWWKKCVKLAKNVIISDN